MFLGSTLRYRLPHCFLHGSSAGEVSELDHRYVLKIVALTDYSDKCHAGLAGSLVITRGVAEENYRLA